MLAAAHIVAGAGIGRRAGRWWLAAVLGFASHFVLDAVPHVDFSSLHDAGVVTSHSSMLAIAAVDALAGLTIAFLLTRRYKQPVIMVAAVFAILPDLAFNSSVIALSYQRTPGFYWICQLHWLCQNRHALSQWPLGLSVQVLVVAIALWIAARPTSEPIPKSSPTEL